ncbi:MAG: hypothetical protein AAFR61_01365 [Bacteroidota bacterium]
MGLLRHISWLLAGLALLPACEFDQDAAFELQTVAGHFLVEDSLGRPQLWQWTPDGMGPEYPFARDAVGDLARWQEEAWVSLPEQQLLVQFHPQSLAIVQQISTAPYQAHYFQPGSREILLSDTMQKALIFYGKKDGRFLAADSLGTPGPLDYRSSHFYVAYAHGLVAIWQEDALAIRRSHVLPAPITDWQQEPTFRNIGFGATDSGLWQVNLNVNDYLLENDPALTSFEKVRISPYLRRIYEKESLATFRLSQGQITGVGLTGVQDFEMDFFENQLFFKQNNQLWRLNLLNNQLIEEGPFPFSMRKALFFALPIGE